MYYFQNWKLLDLVPIDFHPGITFVDFQSWISSCQPLFLCGLESFDDVVSIAMWKLHQVPNI